MWIICPDCNRPTKVRKNGQIRSHQAFTSRPGCQFPPLCDAVGKVFVLDPSEAQAAVDDAILRAGEILKAYPILSGRVRGSCSVESILIGSRFGRYRPDEVDQAWAELDSIREFLGDPGAQKRIQILSKKDLS